MYAEAYKYSKSGQRYPCVGLKYNRPTDKWKSQVRIKQTVVIFTVVCRFYLVASRKQGHTEGGGGYRAAAPQTPNTEI
jgi:hypothetical protein